MRWVFLMLLMAANFDSGAQGFFNQHGAWMKNQLRQVALWELYIKDVEKGYTVAKEGLGIIGEIKNGDFILHLDHFDGLLAVNPAVARYPKAAAIFAMQRWIGKLVIKIDDAYVNSVFMHLMAGCREDVEALMLVLTPGKLQLSDDERIGQIDKLYADMQEKYAFARAFNAEVKLLSVQRVREKRNVNVGKLLNSKVP